VLAGVVINVILTWVAGLMVVLACSMWAVTGYRRMTGLTTGPVPARDRCSGKGCAPPGTGGPASRRDPG
jgi:hypothetical protein